MHPETKKLTQKTFPI